MPIKHNSLLQRHTLTDLAEEVQHKTSETTAASDTTQLPYNRVTQLMFFATDGHSLTSA